MLRILTSVLIWVLVGRLLGSEEILYYLLIGNAATAGMGSWAIAAAAWDRYDGTYPLLVIAPANLAPAIMGRMSIWALGWIVSSLLTFLILLVAFDFRLRWDVLAVVPAFVTLMSLSTFFFSAFLGSFSNLYPPARNLIGWALIFGLMTLTGINVPVTFWSEPVQFVASLLPITHGLQVLRVFIDGGDAATILSGVGIELAVGIGWLALAWLSFNRFAERGRANGSIDLD
ncbi:hypothetical protein GCM10007205_06320 [Oxalicibacterium flavum]|uniref:Uncharacterized protein n=1 Tax=Oxalicibacterium flavum TaxID=179467 RepID=A0A8J2UJJ4_9BURK|nr:hypothetical protein [Oxalicibacterium flavum]GGB99732.1 hypothetical protein GCM10007205_06320 [Oxalicibacterium flavum]